MLTLLTQFGVDWKLLIAQVVNFFILFFLLKKFAYGPILRMLRERREKIEHGIASAKEAEKRLVQSKTKEQEILVAAHENASEVVKNAETTAREQVQIMLDSAEAKKEQIIISGQKKLEQDRRILEEDVLKNAHKLIRTSLERVIGKETDSFNETLIDDALRELKAAV